MFDNNTTLERISDVEGICREYSNTLINENSRNIHYYSSTVNYDCWYDTLDIKLMVAAVYYLYSSDYKKLRFYFNQQSYRDTENGKNTLLGYTSDSASFDEISFSVVYLPSGIVKANATLLDKGKISQYTQQKQLETLLFQEEGHIIHVHKTSSTNTLILTNRWSWNLLRKIIASMPVIIPKQLSGEAIEIFKAYGSLDSDKWVSLINTWLSSGFLEDLQYEKLAKVLKYRQTKRASQLRSTIDGIRGKIDSYEDSIASAIRDLENKINELYAIEIQNDDGSSIEEVKEYLKRNKNIALVKAENNRLYFNVRVPLEYYNEEVLKIYLEKDRVITSTVGKRILKEVFIDKKYKLVTYTLFTLDLYDMRASKNNDIDPIFPEGLPHPHLMRYDCWGDNGTAIKQALRDNNFIQAIEQCMAACYNLNMTDTAVMSYLDNVVNAMRSKKCLLDSDGNYHTIEDILKENENG